MKADPDTETLYVSGFNSVNEQWDETGASPWLNDNTGNYISTSVDEEWHEEFSFADSGVGVGTINSVNLYLEINGPSARNDYVVIDLYNSSGWYNVANQDPDGDGYVWYNFDVSIILSSWSEIDAAKLRVQYQRSGSPSTQTIYVRRSYLYIDYSSGPNVYSFDLPETAAVTDSMETQKALVHSLSETVTVTSSLTTQKTITVTQGTTTAVTTTLETDLGMKEVFTELFEAPAVTATLQVMKGINAVLSASPVVDAVLSSMKGIIAVLSEPLAASASTVLIKVLSVILGESTSVTTTLETSKAISAVVAELFETVNVGAALEVVKSIIVTLDNSLSVTAVLETVKGITAVLGETVAATATSAVTKGINAILSGSLDVTATLETFKHLFATFVEFSETIPAFASLYTLLPIPVLSSDEVLAVCVALIISFFAVSIAIVYARKKNEGG